MKIISNSGNERVVDLLGSIIEPRDQLDVLSTPFSLFAFEAIKHDLLRFSKVQILLPKNGNDLLLLGSEVDRSSRNQLRARWLAKCCAEWLESKAEIRRALNDVPQGTLVIRDKESNAKCETS